MWRWHFSLEEVFFFVCVLFDVYNTRALSFVFCCILLITLFMCFKVCEGFGFLFSIKELVCLCVILYLIWYSCDVEFSAIEYYINAWKDKWMDQFLHAFTRKLSMSFIILPCYWIKNLFPMLHKYESYLLIFTTISSLRFY